MTSWSVVVFRRDYEADRVFVVEPEELAGREVVAVDADACRVPHPTSYGVCGLVRRHRGEHWQCSEELLEKEGPFALKRLP